MFGGIRVLRRGKSQERIHVGELQAQIERTRARVRPRCESVGKEGAKKKNVRRTNQSIASPLGRDRQT